MKQLLALALAVGVLATSAGAQDCSSGACNFAARLNNSRVFRHDPTFKGAEVIYRSSTTATVEAAKAWWMNSPPHRRLLLSGAIQDIACVGNVCVGRSLQAGANITAGAVATTGCAVKASTAVVKRTGARAVRTVRSIANRIPLKFGRCAGCR